MNLESQATIVTRRAAALALDVDLAPAEKPVPSFLQRNLAGNLASPELAFRFAVPAPRPVLRRREMLR
jgi:hypothetical protein